MATDITDNVAAISATSIDRSISTISGALVVGGVAVDSGATVILPVQSDGVNGLFTVSFTYVDLPTPITSHIVWTQIDALDPIAYIFASLRLSAATYCAFVGGPIGARVLLDMAGDSVSRNDDIPTISIWETGISQNVNWSRGNETIVTETTACMASIWAPTRGNARMLRSFFTTTIKSICGNNIVRLEDGDVSRQGFESYGIEFKIPFHITSQLPRYSANIIYHTDQYVSLDTTDTDGDNILGKP